MRGFEAKPLVSIIVPVYNCDKFVKKCLLSIINQTYNEIEIIVVNDGSSDRSHEMISEIAERDGRITYLRQCNAGVAAARNAGIAQAHGKYLLFVDGDDWVGETYVETLLACAEENQSELVISGFTMTWLTGKRAVRIVPKSYKRMGAEEWAYRLSCAGGRLYLRDFWERFQLTFAHEEKARAEDVPLCIFANAMAQNICVTPMAEYYYVQHSGSAMHNKTERVVFRFPYKAFAEMYTRLLALDLYNSREFYYFGILKFLAQFEFIIYRHADKKEKHRFQTYVCELLQDDFDRIIKAWRKIYEKMELPVSHKIAIWIFAYKYKLIMR